MHAETLNTALDKVRTKDGRRRIEACYVGENAAVRMARWLSERSLRRVLLVADANTLAAAGEVAGRALRNEGIAAIQHAYGAETLEASDALGSEVAAAAEGQDAIVAIGSGTLCDLAKYAGGKLGKPAVLFATAASMNGYTSGIVALKVRGLKRTIPCTPAAAVFADPEVVAAAPQRLAAAGVADYLSKCSASADWRAAHLLRGEYFDPEALQFYEGWLDRIVQGAAAVGRGDSQAVADALVALLLSGLSMLQAGSSSPASGGEHLVSHYLDMWSAVYGTPHDLHGAQVGVATVDCLRLWEKLQALEPATIDAAALVKAAPDASRIQAWIAEDWPEPVRSEVAAQWAGKARHGEALRQELAFLKDRHRDLAAAVQPELLPSIVVAHAIEAAGGPVDPASLAAPADVYARGLRRARFIRNRFTVLDLAAEVGWTG